MKASDVRVQDVQLTFSDEKLAAPLRLSKGVIEEITYLQVRVTVVNRQGQEQQGVGAILLSDVWAFPDPAFTHAEKDGVMRAICGELAQHFPQADSYSDPLQKHETLDELLQQAVQNVAHAGDNAVAQALPRLAALNCLAPLDAAIHDGWGKLIGAPSYELYTAEWLNDDLAAYLGRDFRGRYPGDWLHPRRPSLAIQHVVGMGDALHAEEVAAAKEGVGALPQSLAEWIRRDGVYCFKIKTGGQDPFVDAQRIQSVHQTAQDQLGAHAVHLAIDPNESCPDAAFLAECLDYLERFAPAVYGALAYIEQPTGRNLRAYDFTLHDVAQRKPVIIDESLDSLDILTEQLLAQGWSGLAIKTCKGQTLSLLAYAWAKQHGYYITVQDLTNPGIALVHSANLCAHLDLPVEYLECNSRQYMPAACPEARAAYPSYFQAQAGRIAPTSPTPGLY